MGWKPVTSDTPGAKMTSTMTMETNSSSSTNQEASSLQQENLLFVREVLSSSLLSALPIIYVPFYTHMLPFPFMRFWFTSVFRLGEDKLRKVILTSVFFSKAMYAILVPNSSVSSPARYIWTLIVMLACRYLSPLSVPYLLLR